MRQERVGEVKVKAALDCTLTDIFVQIIISVTVHNEVFGAKTVETMQQALC